MKTISLTLLTIGLAGLLLSAAAAQDVPGGNNPPPPTPELDNTNAPGGGMTPSPLPEDITSTNESPGGETQTPGHPTEPVVILPGQSKAAPGGDVQSNFMPPAQPVGTNNPNELRMNFKNAPLEMVLNYLSDAAGFIIVLDTRVNGNVSVISSQPMTRDEAVDLLSSVLNKNGYAAIRNGRTLTIVDKNDAKTRDIPVKSGNNPNAIPNNAEIVTQIIPIRFVEARQLVSDLTSFVSPQATVVANEAGNAIVITDTQANIRHLTEIIKAIDSSAEAETEIRVFRLKYASPADVASELSTIFPGSSGSGGNTQSPINFRGGGGAGPGAFFARMMGGGGGGAGGGGSTGSSSSDRVKKAMQVTAVADSRIQAVIVTAPKDMMDQIASMMTDLDTPSSRDQKVVVFHMNNADPQQAVAVLQDMFQTSGSRSSTSTTTTSPLQKREQNNTTATSTSGTTTGTGAGTTGTGGRASGMQF